MPRVLFITYHYPPRPLSGSVRAGGLAKYLGRFGWDVLVFTPKLPEGYRPAAAVIETEYRNVLAEWKSRFGMDPEAGVHEQLSLKPPAAPNSTRLHSKMLEILRRIIAYPDEQKGWIKFANAKLWEMQGKEHVDLILSTSPPVSCNLIACTAKQMFRRPWIADFRDLWADQLFWDSQQFLLPLLRRLERKTLRSADALVTVSEPWADRLRVSYPEKAVHTITNGFDPDDFSFKPVPLTKSFSLTHAGFLYQGKRDPTILFEVLRDLCREGLVRAADVRVRFYGPPEPWLGKLADSYGVSEMVEICGVIPRKEALLREAESQILVLLGWSDLRETGQHTGKLFEYFGAGRPIIALGGAAGVLTDTLNETKAGVHVTDKAHLRKYLLDAYEEFRRYGRVSYSPDQQSVLRYTHGEMARKFSEILQAAVDSRLSSHDSELAIRAREHVTAP